MFSLHCNKMTLLHCKNIKYKKCPKFNPKRCWMGIQKCQKVEKMVMHRIHKPPPAIQFNTMLMYWNSATPLIFKLSHCLSVLHKHTSFICKCGSLQICNLILRTQPASSEIAPFKFQIRTIQTSFWGCVLSLSNVHKSFSESGAKQ